MDKPKPLSAVEVGSFAYTTVKDRLPVILTRVIDYLCREKLTLIAQYGEVSAEELKHVIGRLSRLKNEMQTNKVMRKFEAIIPIPPHDDTEQWNSVLCNAPVHWFDDPWLLVECYLYKAIHHCFVTTSSIQSLDPFLPDKLLSLDQCRLAVTRLNHLTISALERVQATAESGIENEAVWDSLASLLQMSVWGNQIDLSLSCGSAAGLTADDSSDTTLQQWLEKQKANLLVNDTARVCDLLRDKRRDPRHVALVLDNCGYELVTDVCLSLVMLESGVTNKVVVYPKTRPWFVSDTTVSDIDMLQQWLGEHYPSLCEVWQAARSRGAWEVQEHPYWTSPSTFPHMEQHCPALYRQLQQAKLIIFKGDLNYRKLVSDLSWPPCTPAREAMGTSLCSVGPVLALRTVKGGPVVGAAEHELDRIKEKLGDTWDTSGQCGMLQLTDCQQL